jgi:CII-binding regulator of phage lambda lysogenization HflD
MQCATAKHHGRMRARSRPHTARIPRGQTAVSHFKTVLASALTSVPSKQLALWLDEEEALCAGLHLHVLSEIVREENELRAL